MSSQLSNRKHRMSELHGMKRDIPAAIDWESMKTNCMMLSPVIDLYPSLYPTQIAIPVRDVVKDWDAAAIGFSGFTTVDYGVAERVSSDLPEEIKKSYRMMGMATILVFKGAFLAGEVTQLSVNDAIEMSGLLAAVIKKNMQSKGNKDMHAVLLDSDTEYCGDHVLCRAILSIAVSKSMWQSNYEYLLHTIDHAEKWHKETHGVAPGTPISDVLTGNPDPGYFKMMDRIVKGE